MAVDGSEAGGGGNTASARDEAQAQAAASRRRPAAAAAAAASNTSKRATGTGYRRCGRCQPCLNPECGSCRNCSRKAKFGGDGSGNNQACLDRICETRIQGGGGGSVATAASAPDHAVSSSYGLLQSLDPTGYLLPPRRKKKRKTGPGSDGDGAMMDDNGGDQDEAGDRQRSEEIMYRTLYGGVKVPPVNTAAAGLEDEAVEEVCGGCLLSTQPALLPPVLPGGNKEEEGTPSPPPGGRDDDVVLLCDGPGCGREYHLRCCVPPLKKIPTGAWFCRDCSPAGSTQNLFEYLERVDDYRRRSMELEEEHQSQQQARGGSNSSSSSNSKPPPPSYKQNQQACIRAGLISCAAGVGVPKADIPESEIGRLDEFHFLAQQDVDDDEGGETKKNVAGPPPALRPDFLVGKPVQMFCRDDETELIHTGRIVDFRLIGDDGVVLPPHAGGEQQSGPNNAVAEYLVRFPAGVDCRKTDYQHWIVLEEHALAVGASLVYLDCNDNGNTAAAAAAADPDKMDEDVVTAEEENKSDRSSWQPAMLWLHTALGLLLLDAAIAKESRSTSSKAEGSSSDDHNPSTPPIAGCYNQSFRNRLRDAGSRALLLQQCKSKKHQDNKSNHQRTQRMYAFAKPCSVDAPYLYRDVKTQCAGFFSPQASNEYTSSHQDKFWGWMAMVECQEQETVRLWRDLPLKNVWLPQALSSRDQYTLGPLLATRPPDHHRDMVKQKRSNPNGTAPVAVQPALCPLVSRGLDRLRILDLLDRQGVHPSKDAACTLSCRIVSLSSVASDDPVFSE